MSIEPNTIVICKEQYDDVSYIVHSEEGLHRLAKMILLYRFNQGWYDESDEIDRIRSVVIGGDGREAWEILQQRKRAEYENIVVYKPRDVYV